MREGFLVNFTSMNDAMAQQQGQAICKDAATCKAICENSFSPFANKLFEQILTYKDDSQKRRNLDSTEYKISIDSGFEIVSAPNGLYDYININGENQQYIKSNIDKLNVLNTLKDNDLFDFNKAQIDRAYKNKTDNPNGGGTIKSSDTQNNFAPINSTQPATIYSMPNIMISFLNIAMIIIVFIKF